MPTKDELYKEVIKGAKCKGRTDIMYPTSNEEEVAAKRFCNGTDGTPRCPVHDVCLEYGMAINDKEGIYGGRTAQERDAIRRRRRKIA